jgi:predicted nucleotidyltransferase
MNTLSEKESSLINSVLEQHPEVSLVTLFGSRAKGCHTNASDIDLALWGVDALQAEAIASELDELPLPYSFDVKAFESIKQESLREHILRKGIDWNRTSPASRSAAMFSTTPTALLPSKNSCRLLRFGVVTI